AIGLSAYDIIWRGISSDTSHFHVIVASGSYFLMCFSAVLIGLRRLITVKKALLDIPKSKLPISKKILPKSVHNLIMSELIRVSMISLESEPKPEDGGQPGWGRPGTSLDNINFKISIVDTLTLIEKNAYEHSHLKRQPSMSAQRFIDFLIENKAIDRNLGHAYVEGYERARFSDEEIPEEQYTEFMKLVVQLLRKLGFNES
ncbi:16824_t:CDS:2, partial [Acaulospora morrowiae]